MDIAVRRTHYSHTRQNGLDVLEQRFRFDGPAADVRAISDVLLPAPLVGAGSVFGERPGVEAPSGGASRRLDDFSPAPGRVVLLGSAERAV